MMSRSSRLASSHARLPLFAASSITSSRLLLPTTCRHHASIHSAPARHSTPQPSSHHFARRRNQSSWAAAAQAASVAQHIRAAPPPDAPLKMDPFQTVAREMKFLTGNIRSLLGSGHPTLDTVAKYYTQSEGKYVRPMLVLLMSRATALTPKIARSGGSGSNSVDAPFTSASILQDENPHASTPSVANDAAYTPSPADADADILPSQRRLAEITELIHTASLMHDDVIDHSVARRGAASANVEFGNKMAVLAGDFLLGRASVALARLRDPEATELLATVVANLVEGEFMQLQNTARDEKNPAWTQDTLTYYLQKTYLKSASLISKSCRAAAVLGSCTPDVVEASYQYGKNLGMAFQLVDDMLDYTVSSAELGKPGGADLELGLATAPLLFAWKDNAALGKLVGRKFTHAGDAEKARDIVLASTGLQQTRALAQDYIDKAIAAIAPFPESDAKNGLLEMCTKVLQRRK